MRAGINQPRSKKLSEKCGSRRKTSRRNTKRNCRRSGREMEALPTLAILRPLLPETRTRNRGPRG